MSTTQAQAAVMEQVAMRFDDVHQSLQTMLSQLIREIDAVKEGWQGRGGASFEQVNLAWAAEQQRLLRALEQTAEAIRTAGRVYSATDDHAAARLRQTTITLPL